ncbi:MAG: hypothetical protein COU72_03315 [Parcubacteria group bacterium CG10_big_fil_rev_8_21_14_0_10_41_35]|nr:MAG: hypothetical protein COU72_03315 [Parcubacteria group bacterium CG10_big_fil_rev_8_21_14_0_10_41_35]
MQYFKLGRDWTDIAPNVRFKFYDAGHILGSAVIVVQIKENGSTKTIAFTGDLGRKNAPILCDPEYIQEDVDILLSESTYGDRVHEPFERTEAFIQDIIERTIKHQAKVIVPAFALGRTQELIYLLHKLFNIQGFPKIPIVLDSPLATRVTEVFKKHRNVFDSQSWKDFDPKKDLPLVFDHLTFTEGVQDSIALNSAIGPMMIISASGMMEAGRVLHHLKNNIENPNNTILITGFQAENTLGRRIQDGVKSIRIFNREYRVRAQVVTAPALSAHADQKELLDYIANTKGLKKLFLVHGEQGIINMFAELVRGQNPNLDIQIPERGQEFEI